jgi:hypothetical protein
MATLSAWTTFLGTVGSNLPPVPASVAAFVAANTPAAAATVNWVNGISAPDANGLVRIQALEQYRAGWLYAFDPVKNNWPPSDLRYITIDQNCQDAQNAYSDQQRGIPLVYQQVQLPVLVPGTTIYRCTGAEVPNAISIMNSLNTLELAVEYYTAKYTVPVNPGATGFSPSP